MTLYYTCLYVYIAWQPRDVQELCRVLFDALEKRFKKDDYESSKDLINDLYQGNMKDYVKCLEVTKYTPHTCTETKNNAIVMILSTMC